MILCFEAVGVMGQAAKCVDTVEIRIENLRGVFLWMRGCPFFQQGSTMLEKLGRAPQAPVPAIGACAWVISLEAPQAWFLARKLFFNPYFYYFSLCSRLCSFLPVLLAHLSLAPQVSVELSDTPEQRAREKRHGNDERRGREKERQRVREGTRVRE